MLSKIDLLCLALFDASQQQNVFERLNECTKNRQDVLEETKQLKTASDKLQSEIIALDEKRTATSKMIDASFPPEAKQAAQAYFLSKFQTYYDQIKETISQQMMDAHELEIQTSSKLIKAQEIELQTIQELKQ